MAQQQKTILVVGGGIAGMVTALHIAESGQRALVIDEALSIGGSLPLLDKTFPTDSCALCFSVPNPPAVCPFFECEHHPLIEIRTLTRLENLDGNPGALKATLQSEPRFVDPEVCTGCGLCQDVCPISVEARFQGGRWIGEAHKAIYLPFPQAVPAGFTVDPTACNRCHKCVSACPENAINLDDCSRTEIVEVGAVVLAPGFGPTDARLRSAYGYGEYPNVVTSMEYERMLSTSSPNHGGPFRPSDGRAPRRIAFIQCVGSRDQQSGVPYCSTVCCMITAKQISLTKSRDPEARMAVFTMDVRAGGRGYERYLAEVQAKTGVEYRRSLVSGVKLDPATQDLHLQYVEAGRAAIETFDLVVLSVGMVAPVQLHEMARRIDVELNDHGFVTTSGNRPVATSRPGVFVAGAFREPKDVAATVVEATAAAAQALETLGSPLEVRESVVAVTACETNFYDLTRAGVSADESETVLKAAVKVREGTQEEASPPIQVDKPEARALVLGGGLAGLTAALTLSAQGFETHVVERSDQLGGWQQRTWDGDIPWLEVLISEVESNPAIKNHLSSRLVKSNGRPGHRVALVASPNGRIQIPYGAMVVATGAQEHRPVDYGLESDPATITQGELGVMIQGWKKGHIPFDPPRSVIMIQCAGTRSWERPYCSKTCCGDALKNAIWLKETIPGMSVTIVFRDIVTPGFDESLYSQARGKGVLFLRHTRKREPIIRSREVTVFDDVLREEVRLHADLLVLSSGIISDPETPALADVLGLPMDEDGFFQPLNIKTQPMDLPCAGFYLAGLAGGPATLVETIEQGMGAGLRAGLFLRRSMETPLYLAAVNERICSGCGLCVDFCPVGARSIDPYEGVAQVDPWLCIGCGTCAAVCPSGASIQRFYETAGVLERLDAALG